MPVSSLKDADDERRRHHISSADTFKQSWHIQADLKSQYPYNVVQVRTTTAKQLQTHFEGLFNDYISAYRKGYKCQIFLLDLIDQRRTAFNNKLYTC